MCSSPLLRIREKKYLFDSEMGARIRNALVAHSRQLANVQTCTYTCKNVVVYLSVGVCKLLLLHDVVVESWMHMLISTISDYLYISPLQKQNYRLLYDCPFRRYLAFKTSVLLICSPVN